MNAHLRQGILRAMPSRSARGRTVTVGRRKPTPAARCRRCL